jgi:hypothetical protein
VLSGVPSRTLKEYILVGSSDSEKSPASELHTCEFFFSLLQWTKLTWQQASQGDDEDDQSLPSPHLFSRQIHENIHFELLKKIIFFTQKGSSLAKACGFRLNFQICYFIFIC